MEHGAGGDDGGNVSKLRDVRDGRFRLERESNGNADEGRGEISMEHHHEAYAVLLDTTRPSEFQHGG